MPWTRWSLRAKLVAACVLVQLAAAALLVWDGAARLQRALIEQARFETEQVVALLEVAIAAPLAQRDYAVLQQTLDRVLREDAITYLVLRDHRGRHVASSGWDAARPLPPRDGGRIDLARRDATLHMAAPILVAGQRLGELDLGLSYARLRQTRADFLGRSLIVGGLALAASAALLGAIALAVTQHLARLAKASQRVAEGDFDVAVPVTTHDEIGSLGASFNAMAGALKERMWALEASEAQQKGHLLAAREEQSRLTTLLGAMQSGIVFVDPAGSIVYANRAFTRLWGLTTLVEGQPLAGIVTALRQQVVAADVAHIDGMLSPPTGHPVAVGELRLRDGRIIVQRMQGVENDLRGGQIWFHDDVTLERRTQQRALQALQDPLTGLVNRRGLLDALQSSLAGAAGNGETLAMLFIDLDDFKHANDVAGHRAGDDILVGVARALEEQMRRGELVARLGGDEFAVLCPRTDTAGAASIARRLIEVVSGLHFASPAGSLQVGCSIGIASYPADARSGDELLAAADAAMYDAKRSGKNGWAAYRDDPQRTAAETARIGWNGRIHRALQAQAFVLHFQPVCRAGDLRVMHHEALLRMLDERVPAQLIPPADFIAHAERSGAIRQIDRWVFETCVTQLAASGPEQCLAVNLSARSLEDTGFHGFLRGLLQRHDVDPRRLHIELTETSAIGDPVAARTLIDGLRGLGCAVHLDDFGSGFSSFAHLKLLDVDAIKIDGVFVRQLLADSSNRLFVGSMIAIAHELGKTVIAEHVEDPQTLDALRDLGVDLVQGFHLGRPTLQPAPAIALGGSVRRLRDFRVSTRKESA